MGPWDRGPLDPSVYPFGSGFDRAAVGTHQRYEYEEVVGQGANIFQQYIVMSEVTGNFTDGEVLTGTPT